MTLSGEETALLVGSSAASHALVQECFETHYCL